MPTTKVPGDDGVNDGQHNNDLNGSSYRRFDPENFVQSRNSQMLQLENGLNINLEVHGNTLINAGDKVTVNIPYTAALKAADNKSTDKFYQGPFLIKSIRHDFNVVAQPAQHRMYMNLVKDSLEEQLVGPNDNPEPQDDKETGFIEEYSYTG